VAWKKPGTFIGRQSLEGRRELVPRRRLVQLAVPDPAPLLFGTEPVWRDGQLVGYLRSAGYGHTLDCGVGMGYLNHDAGVTSEWLAGGKFEVEIATRRYPAVASLRPFYDPGRTRVKGESGPTEELIAAALRAPR